MLRGIVLELQQQKGIVELRVLGSWCLLKPIEYLVQTQYLVRVVIVQETRWLSNVDGLLQLSVEESGLHVHVVDLPRIMCRNRQQ